MATVPFDRFLQNRVSFVTFNYDRSLEHFFRTSLTNSYGKTPVEVDGALSNTAMIHVHGQLGALKGKDGRPFKPDLSSPDVQNAMKDIVIMGDAPHESDEFDKARSLLRRAKHIFFLGLG